jgi:hypothetical protein
VGKIRTRFGRLLVALCVILGGVASFSSRPAAAQDAEFDFNVLGDKNGDGWGNQGGLASVQWLIDVYRITHALGDNWPTVVSTQETCWDDDVSNDQYQVLLNALWSDTGNTYVQAYAPLGSGNPNRPTCERVGLGLIARATNIYSVWKSTLSYSYSTPDAQDPSDTSTPRKLLCLYPRVIFYDYVSCNTHLTNKSSSVRTHQLNEAGWVYTLEKANHDIQFAGDLNMDKDVNQFDTWYASELEFSGSRSSAPDTVSMCPVGASSCSQKKIDFIWYAGFLRSVIGVVVDPPYEPIPVCVCYAPKPYSDHRLLRAYLTP